MIPRDSWYRRDGKYSMTRTYTPEQRARARERSRRWRKEHPEKYAHVRERSKQWHKEHPERMREYQSAWRQRDPCGSILINIRRRAKYKGIEFTLTREWLEPRLNTGICEMTGLPFDRNHGTWWRQNPFYPSIDRRDPDQGYTEENCRLVIWAYNTAKNTWSDETTLEIARALVSAAERKIVSGESEA